MKQETKIHQIKQELEEKKLRLNAQLESVNHEITRLQDQCTHKIVVKFAQEDEEIGEIHLYYCPSCGKKENTCIHYKLNKTCFKNSKLIDLTELKIDSYNNTLNMVQEEVFEHPEYYYNDETTTEQLSETMSKMIKFKNSKNNKVKRIRNI